ncbi:hypothetical protein ESY86_19360 [Subsaximicrobium wynnwilliamsii]|uniref:Uncharacterized protein n=1 Tax=Subsaximicrobium wynnwilliamsii TaxID=291179 RepID=A0A5C6ZBF8_9FLAO|nr:hypothetical protein [Subsaximicrobium wynnwilliamsii]TXD81092.1 hypothetical protein ESY87_19385 [Subsaximicrobium wynnwilliamsii]TXD86766.1 hypothetical protein ESY86_19360 [Subsaximicrobium wynnwilliamsii]TXE00395.1 hypothetical protein ESY88_19450 [Subsaximicrobium wynnwilliamsii]
MIIFFGIALVNINLPLNKLRISGTYVSNEREPFLADTPYKSDTLILNPNGSYSSKFYGSGTYAIDYGIFTSKIRLTYRSQFGSASHSLTFSDKVYETQKIMLNNELNHYYEKLE